MNDCNHHKSLVAIPTLKDTYVCVSCGWKFKIMHVVDPIFDAIIQKKKVTKGIIKLALEEAIQDWIKEQNKK